MKKIISIFVFAALICSCKKDEKHPVSTTGYTPVNNLYDFRAFGYQSIDTSLILRNNKVYYKNPNGYHVAFSNGDTLDIYFTGKLKSENDPCEFSIWNAGNFLPETTIKKINATKKVFSHLNITYTNDTIINAGIDTVIITRPVDTTIIIDKIEAYIKAKIILN